MGRFFNLCYNLPNLISCARLILACLLFYLAWNGFELTFLVILALAFLSDILDGALARALDQVTEFGAMLDTWADLSVYLAVGFGSWWLWPEIVHAVDLYLYAIVGCFVLPNLYSTLKFNTYTSYHTLANKLAAFFIGLSLFPLFLANISWPFKISVMIYLFAAIEDILITRYLEKPIANIKHLGQLFSEKHSRS